MQSFKGFIAQEEQARLLEHGLARLQHHIHGGSVGIVSSATGSGDPVARQHQLIQAARDKGYGPIVARGKTKDWGSESSVVIPNISLGHLKQLGNQFGQQAVIHASHDQAHSHWLSASGEKNGSAEEIGHVHYNKKNDLGVTVLKGMGYRPRDSRTPERSFTFAECIEEGLLALEVPPTGRLNPLWTPYR